MSDLTDLYSCSKHSKNPDTSFDEYDVKINEIYEELKNSAVDRQEDVAYSDGQMTKIDVWGPASAEKLFVMIHGGYWLIGNRKKCLAVSKAALKLGYTVVSVGYDYVNKEHPLTKTIEETVSGVEFALAKFPNAKKVVIGGHSVGAHLAFRVVTQIQDPRLSGAFLCAGLYKLQELTLTKYGEDLSLSAQEAESCSCDYQLLKSVKFPILITNCKIESPKLFEQNVEFAREVPNAQYKEYPNDDHYTILTELSNEKSDVYSDFYNFLHSF